MLKSSQIYLLARQNCSDFPQLPNVVIFVFNLIRQQLFNIKRAMNCYWREKFFTNSSLSIEEEDELVIKQILLSHDPIHHDLDAEMLLRAAETIWRYTTASKQVNVTDEQLDATDLSSIEMDESQDALAIAIYQISRETFECQKGGNIHASTLSMFESLGNHTWDVKLALSILAFVTIYSQFWVLVQSRHTNSLAASIALLKQLPENFNKIKPLFKALSSMANAFMEVTRCVMKIEGLPISYVEMDEKIVSVLKKLTYVAAYWVVRSCLVCASKVAKFRALTDEHPDLVLISVWELSSLESRIKRIGTRLKLQVDACQQQTETKMHQKLLNIFKERHGNNQEVLPMLFALKNDLPLKHSSLQEKIAISALENKVVILLISDPEILPIEELLLLVHQTQDDPNSHTNREEPYKIIWVPISPSGKWTGTEITTYSFLSNSLPWYSIRHPWSLCSATVNYVKKEWGFEKKPIMVALDLQGMVANLNAIDMVWIWGKNAYPFSSLREVELWEEEHWSLGLLVENVDQLLTLWVEQRRTICIYGSNNLDWIRDFTTNMKKIQSFVQLEVIYVGNKNPSENLSNILSAIDKEKLSRHLSFTKMRLFWVRLESMQGSLRRIGKTVETDPILKEVQILLSSGEIESDKGWMIIGNGDSTNTLNLNSNEIMKVTNLMPEWRKHLPKLGIIDAIRIAIEAPTLDKPCHYERVVSCKEEMEEVTLCEKCKRPLKKYVVYKA